MCRNVKYHCRQARHITSIISSKSLAVIAFVATARRNSVGQANSVASPPLGRNSA
jgi:hypothetical protein